MAQIVYNTYGKARVRLVKLTRHDTYRHDLKQLNVKVLLEGDFDSSYSAADNSKVVPTDTCKNIVYVVAREHPINSIEAFAMALSEKFLSNYTQVHAVDVEISEDLWERMIINGEPHGHSFSKLPYVKICHLRASRTTLDIESGLRELTILKTTQSGFEGYPKCQYTTLPETRDRLLGTTVQALWNYTSEVVNTRYRSIDFDKVFQEVKKHILEVFATHYSPSVQHTIYLIGDKILKSMPVIERITLTMPNLHNWSVDYSKLKLPPSNEVFIPVDEPHGLIKATLTRSNQSQRARL
jgi:urate oxidase